MSYNFISMYLLVLALLIFNFIDISLTDNVKKSIDNLEDNEDIADEGKGENLSIPSETEPANATCTRRQNSGMHEIRSASYNQFPFMVAIMTNQNEHKCSGSIVSRGLILTTAECAQQPINYVLLNTTSDKKENTTVALRIIKTDTFPSYRGKESLKDVAILYTEKHNRSIASKINLSNITNTKDIVDLEALGFGLNADVGKVKELQYVGVELRVTEGDRSEAYIDCIDTKVPTCFKDFGGPVIVDNQLFGIITEGSPVCVKEMHSSYAVNKRIVQILPTFTFKAWLDEIIRKNQEQGLMALETYPSKPTKQVARKTAHVMTSTGQCLLASKYISVLICVFPIVCYF